MHYAAASDSLSVVQRVCKLNLPINSPSLTMYAPLRACKFQVATHRSWGEGVACADRETPLHVAAQRGIDAVILMLVDVRVF